MRSKSILKAAIASVLLLIFCKEFDSIINIIGADYQKIWPLFHYGYEEIDNCDYVKRLSYSEKIICHKDYYDQAMREFLEGKSLPTRDLLHSWGERKTESIWIGGRHYVIKTGMKKGFFANLMKIGLGAQIWNNAHRAKRLGIPTLKPIVFWEKRELAHSESIILYLWEGTSGDNVFKERGDFLPEVDKLFAKLSSHSVLQRSFSLKNIVILESGAPQLIDIDDMHQYPKYSFVFHKRLKREMENYKKNCDLLRPSFTSP